MKKLIKKLIILVIILIIGGTGTYFYLQYKKEQARKIAEEEKRRQEEMEKEKQKKLLEEKKKEFEKLLSEMKKYFEEGNYKKVKELAEKAFALAKKYGFPEEEIKKLLHQIEVKKYLDKLKKLKVLNEDIFYYYYVRGEVMKIPSWPELIKLKKEIIKKTYENEYLVYLTYAEIAAKNGKEGKQPRTNYFMSRKYLDAGVKLRKRKNIEKNEKEKKIVDIQKQLYFSSKSLFGNTIPSFLY